jgi:hypothetical protein
MRVITSILILTFFSLSSQGQLDTASQSEKEWSPSYKIEAEFEANYGSTDLNNEFIDKLLFGGQITPELKDKVLKRTNNRNRFGVELNYEIKFTELTDTVFPSLPAYRYYIGFGSYTNLSASYTKDLYKLAFYGNTQFENETAQLGKSNFTSYRFEKITFGLMHQNESTSFGISLIVGDQFSGFNFKQADLFTFTDGVDLSLEYDGKIRLSDRERRGFMAFSGAGIGIDFETLVYKKMFRLKVTNLGVAFWKRNTSFSHTQETKEFDGVEISNVFSTSQEEFLENANALLPEMTDQGFVTLLPTIIELHKKTNPELQSQPIYGIRYKFFSNYLPQLYGGIQHQLSSKFVVRGDVTWGGYSGLRLGVGAFYHTKRIQAGIQSTNLSGMFFQNGNGNGFSAFGTFLF